MKLRLFITSLFLFLFSFSAFAADDGWDDDTTTPGGPPPPPTLDVGAQKKPNTPIDMYDTALFIIGVTMISGYYFYSRKRMANS